MNDNDDIQYDYYDWEGFLCRSTGNIFKGKAERLTREGWKPAHFFDLKEKGTPINRIEAKELEQKLNTRFAG